MVVVESGSMMHDRETGSLGAIDPGDLVLVMDPSRVEIITFAQATELDGDNEGYESHGMPGDVIIFRKNGGTDTPVIHRALFEVVPNTEGGWDVPGTDIVGVESITIELDYPCYHGSTNLRIEEWVPEHGGYITTGDNKWSNGCQYDQISLKDENNNLDKMPSAIITVNYNGIMFALTMETHVGIVTINSTSNYKIAEASESENTSDLLKDIVWYEEQNLFIFSPEKISMLVFSELKNQIAVRTEEDIDSKSSEEEITDLRHDYMVANIKNSTIAIEITKVLEVIEGSDVTPLYKVADFIRGLISLRGQVLSCIDLSKYLGHELTVIDERNKFIVISVSGVDFALCIDRVLGIQSIQQSSFQDSTKVFQNDIPNYFPNFREKGGEVTLIFKPDFFLKSAELQEYKKN